MPKKILVITFYCIASLLFTYNSYATVSIDSIKAVPSTCTNNGSITIFAKTTTGSLLYKITSGPLTLPVQTSNVFSSLPPGDYTIEVSNTNNEKQIITTTVTGNYQLPDFTPLITPPDCPSNSTGIINGNPTASSGLTPYTWELIAPSPVTRPQQGSALFNNIPQGTYSIRMTDACNNIQTKSVIVFTPPNTMSHLGDFVNITGCDTAQASLILLVSEDRPPYKISYTAGGQNYTIDTAKLTPSQGSIMPILPGPNVTYGGAFYNITVTNSCGTQLFIPYVGVCDFKFWAYYVPIAAKDCVPGLLTTIPFGEQGVCGNTVPKYPFTVFIRDGITNNLLETKKYTNVYDGTYTSQVMEPGKNYNITIQDSCNHQYTNPVTTPAIKRYVDFSISGQQTLLDSTAITYIYAHGFPTVGTTFTILDGPPFAQSTKHGYVYHEDYTYPKSFVFQTQSDSSLVTPIWNMAAGKYHLSITDSCGNVYLDSFTINQADVANFYFKYDYTKGCSGESGLLYEFIHNTFASIQVKDIKSGNLIYTQYAGNAVNPFTGVINNLKATDYEMSIIYGSAYTKDNSLTNILTGEFIAKDTIHILPYQNPSLQTNTSVLCSGNLSLILTADSTKGIPPYQYEIISGPQTFPPQASNLFQLTQKGPYRIRVTDKCGNSSATDVTVDDLVFPPLSKIGSSCINSTAELTYGASPYFSYTWTKPNGTIFKGDTLLISPITSADTGVYTVSRLTTINGCSSTQSTTYLLTAGAKDSVAVTICSGQTYTFGTKTLTLQGIYRDTIISSFCDSISILNLSVVDFKRNNISASICAGQSYVFGNRTLTLPNTYIDTLTTSTCDSIVILILTVGDYKRTNIAASICNGQSYVFGNRTLTVANIYIDTLTTSTCDSIVTLTLTVGDYKRTSIAASICNGQSYVFGNKTLTVANTYTDTLTTSTCDSIVTLTLTVGDYKRTSIAASICNGQSYVFGNRTLTLPNTYIDTLTTSTCDSIVTLTLTVGDYKRTSIAASICNGQSYIFGNRTLTVANIYIDTLTTSTCDSIVTLTLTVGDYKRTSIAVSICNGQSYIFGNRTLTTPNTYTDTIKTTGCDSIVTLALTVGDYKRSNISASICNGQSYVFGNRTLTTPNTYTDTIKTTGCDSIVTLALTVGDYKRTNISASICNGQSYVFGNRTLTTANTYSDTLTTSGCDSIVTLVLTVGDYKRTNITASICNGQSYVFGNRTLTTANTYTDTLQTSTCDSIVTLTLTVNNAPSVNIQSDKVEVIKGETIQLTVVPSTFKTYLWTAQNSLNNNAIRNPTSVVNVSSIYKVLVTDNNNCTNTDSIFIQIVEDSIIHTCTSTNLYLPSAFTPNNDGRNDKFRVLGATNVGYKDFYLMIYNRWGEKVFESSNPHKHWDGRYKGQPADQGNYVYMLRFICEDGTTFTHKGNILLFR